MMSRKNRLPKSGIALVGRYGIQAVVATAAILACALVACGGDDNPTGPGQTPVSLLTIALPANHAVVADTVTVTAVPDSGIMLTAVEFYRDGVPVAGGRDTLPPFSRLFDLSGLGVGDSVVVTALGFNDTGDSSFSAPVVIHHLWRLLLSDPDEPHDRDISAVFVRSSDTTVEFRVALNGNWRTYKDYLDGIDFAVWFDTDRNPATGDTDTDSGQRSINDIGADIQSLLGYHGDSVRQWIPAGSGGWVQVHGPSGFVRRLFPPDTNVFEFAIRRSVLPDTPRSVDIVCANISPDTLIDSTGTDTVQVIPWDFAPDSGHATYDLGDMIGAFPASPPAPDRNAVRSDRPRESSPFD